MLLLLLLNAPGGENLQLNDVRNTCEQKHAW
jgi:hypothetical protein